MIPEGSECDIPDMVMIKAEVHFVAIRALRGVYVCAVESAFGVA